MYDSAWRLVVVPQLISQLLKDTVEMKDTVVKKVHAKGAHTEQLVAK